MAERLWCRVCFREVACQPKGGKDGEMRPMRHGKGGPCPGQDQPALWEPPAGVEPQRQRIHTETSSFGVSGRTSHDATRYYARALEHAEITKDTTINACAVPDQLFAHTSEVMSELADNSVALVVTSPSYHVGKVYDLDIGFVDFLAMLYRVFAECYRVLEPGGRAVINVANLGRKPYVHFSDHVVQACREIGFLPRGEIIWVKGKGASGSIAVGSFASPANPVLRDLHEYLVCFSKGRFDRALHWKERREAGLPWEATISGEEFLDCTLSVWNMRPESAKRVGHPAPFPVELPRRLIEFYTYRGDVVLDPFMGAGTTAVAAAMTDRRYVGYDLDDGYLDIARERIEAALAGIRPVTPRMQDDGGEESK